MRLVTQGVLALAMVLCSELALAKAGEFKIATIAPDGTSTMKQLRAAANEIKERTQSRAKLKFYPGGVMGNDKTVLRKIKLGQLQGAVFTSGTVAKIDLAADLYSLPMVFRNMDEVVYVREQMDGQIQARIEDKGFVALGISNGGFAYLMADRPVSSLEGLKTHKIWVPEGDSLTSTTFVQGGIRTVPLPISDVYTGLQTGLIDTVTATPSGTIALQWHTKIKYMVDFPLIHLTGFLVVQRKAFEKLSAEDQAIMREVIGGTFAELNQLNEKDNREARTALRTQGVVIGTLTEQESERWRALAEKSVAEIEALDEFPRDLFSVLMEHLATYRSEVAVGN
jgi:TRAP-type C4-dicarboxylate transport system substrate-binding protein